MKFVNGLVVNEANVLHSLAHLFIEVIVRPCTLGILRQTIPEYG